MDAGPGSVIDEHLIESVAWYDKTAARWQSRRQRRPPIDVNADAAGRSNGKRADVVEEARLLQQPDAPHVEAITTRLWPVPRPVLDQCGAPAESRERVCGAASRGTATDHDSVEIVRNADHGGSVVRISCQLSVVSQRTCCLLTTDD